MAGKPKTRLEGLEVEKVDVVDVGADQEADILITKKGGEPEGKEPFYKRFFHSVCKSLGLDGPTVEKAMGDFNGKMQEKSIEKARDEVWDASYALQASIASILADENVENKDIAICRSIDQFSEFAKGAARKWAGFEATGNIEGVGRAADSFEVSKMQGLVEKSLAASMGAAGRVADGKNMAGSSQEEKEDNMTLDISKMSPGEKAFYEELKKRYGTGGSTGAEAASGQGAGAAVGAGVAAADVQGEVQKAVQAAVTEVMKGMKEQMEAAFAPVQKRAEELEQAELGEVAKKYEILGVAPDKMVPVLKSLKGASQEAYDGFLATMDAQVVAIEKSGLFSEIGKSGSNGGGDAQGLTPDEAWAAIEKRADGLMAKDAGLTRAQAIDRVCMANPSLVHAYEKQ